MSFNPPRKAVPLQDVTDKAKFPQREAHPSQMDVSVNSS